MNKYVKLSEVCKISGRVGWKGYTVNDLRPNGPWVIGANDITSTNILDLSEAKHISREKFEESPEIKIEINDILIVKVGSTIGKIAIVDKDIGEATINPNTVLLKNCKINPHYLYYYLISSAGQQYIKNHSSASAQPALNQKDLKEMPVKLFNSAIHNKISNQLKAFNKKIDINKNINRELVNQAKAIYDYWFIQYDFPDKNGKPYKSSGGKMVYNEDLKREIPIGWNVNELGNEIEIKRGISYKSVEIKGNGIPMINLNSFNLDGTYKESGVKMYSGKYATKNLVKGGDLLIAVTDVTRNADIIGKSILVPFYYDELVYSMDIAKVIPKENLTESYLMMLFNSEHYHNYIKWYASGTIVLHLNMDGMKWYKAELPPKSLLEKFDLIYKPIAKRIAETTKQNNQLADLRDWLLPMLMNGQVTVKETEEHINQAAEPQENYS